MVKRHLAIAEERVALFHEYIALQIEIVGELEPDDHDASTARTALQTFQDLQVTHESDRDRLRKELAN